MIIPAVQCFLVNQLHRQLRCQGVDIDPEDIPVYPLKNSWPIQYRSAIALKLAKIRRQNPADIADQIVGGFLFPREGVEITIEVISNGTIAFELSDRGVAAWLQQRTKIPLPASSFPGLLTEIPPKNIDKNLFSVQYSHARCCSLLRLGDRDGIVKLAEPDPQTAPPLWIFAEPDPIPWLNVEEKLRLDHPGECELIWQLFTALDGCCTASDRQFWQNKAVLVSEGFQGFYSQCRIWGEVKLNAPEKAQVRLGLICVTQAILRYILQEKLGVLAPLEL